MGVGYSEAAKAAGRKAYKKCKKAGGSRREARNAYDLARYRAEPAVFRARQKKSNSALKAEIIAAYGGHCVACGELDPAALTVDHKFDDGASERRELGLTGGGGAPFYSKLKARGFPTERYQLLCWSCQHRKQAYGPDFTAWPVFFAES